MPRLLPAFAAALTLAATAHAQPVPATASATSPDGKIVLTVSTDNDQRAKWSLTNKGKLLVAPSGWALSSPMAST
jgi:alpha-glucosidase